MFYQPSDFSDLRRILGCLCILPLLEFRSLIDAARSYKAVIFERTASFQLPLAKLVKYKVYRAWAPRHTHFTCMFPRSSECVGSSICLFGDLRARASAGLGRFWQASGCRDVRKCISSFFHELNHHDKDGRSSLMVAAPAERHNHHPGNP